MAAFPRGSPSRKIQIDLNDAAILTLMNDRGGALKLFIKINQTGVSRAGHDLGLSASAALRIIAALESEIGAALFSRQGRAVELTGAGRELLTQIEPILSTLDETYRTVSARELTRHV